LKTALLIIGDEILSGDTLDTNSHFATSLLRNNGFSVEHILAAGDRATPIRTALDFLFGQVDIVISTGGLGPTKDDITKQTLTDYFGTELVLNDNVYEQLKKWLAGRGREVNELNKQQAMVPAAAETFLNPVGTAPVFWFRKGDNKHLITLPGVPKEMRHILQEIIVPVLKERFTHESIQQLTIQTVGIGESDLAMTIEDIENKIEAANSDGEFYKLAYLPTLGPVRLQLTGKGEDENKIRHRLEEFKNEIAERVNKYVFGYGSTSFPEAIGEMLRSRNATLATAESCTGGYIAHLITSIAGSSDYYIGSVVSYANEVKVHELGVSEETIAQHGAVSEASLKQMLAGALKKFGTTYVLATTGIAGPGGGTPEKPVGSVWIGVADGNGMNCRYLRFNRKREENIHLFSIIALDMLRRRMLGIANNE
jgi:nicotinamide-nucleotide amidase